MGGDTQAPKPASAEDVAAAAKICAKCGATIPPSFRFCGKCGTPLEEAVEKVKDTVQEEQQKILGRLIFIRPDGSEGGEHQLVEGENRIGRNHGEVFKSDGYLSPEHGVLQVSGNEIVLKDEGSLNGVFYKITQEEELKSGDIFRVGQELLRFDSIHKPESLEDGTDIMGSPNKGFWGRLTVIVGYGVDGNAFPVNGERVQIGRERGDILFPEDGYVSGAHLDITKKDENITLKDLDSSNGTFLKVRAEKVVPNGTFILMGQQLFRLSLD